MDYAYRVEWSPEDNEFVGPSDKGALTVPLLPGVEFELVHSQPGI